MSLTSSPRQDIAELIGRGRILTVVPKDQQKLLDRQDSWAVDLKNAPHGAANVPGHVLETAIQAYRARRDSHMSRSNTPDGSERSNHEDNHEDNHDEPSTSRSDAVPPSSPEIVYIDWENTPKKSQPGRQSPVGSPVIRETPKPPPMAPPPPPKLQLHQMPTFVDELQSSDQEDLEVELPEAQALLDLPVNMAAAGPAPTATPSHEDSTQAVETPPCAQPIQKVARVTVVEKASVSTKPIEGRRRRHKPIELTSSPIKAAVPAAAPRRMPTTRSFLNDLDSSQSLLSSSMVPATNSSSGSGVASVELPLDPAAPAEQEINQIDVRMDDVVEATQQSPAARPQIAAEQSAADRKPETAPALVVKQSTADLVEQPTPAGRCAPRNPFEVFAVAYPDYVTVHKGCLWNFVKACVCVEIFQKGRSLRQCLYDDFIRAFSGEYLAYITKAGPGQEPLPALEWFNNLPELPVYNQMIITNRNLEYVLNCFPSEVGRARQIFRGPDSVDDVAQEARRAQKKPPVLRPLKLRGLSSNLGSDEAMDVDSPQATVPDVETVAPDVEASEAAADPPSQPRTPPTLYPRLPRTQLPLPPSPQLGSVPSTPAATPTASAPSRYLERLASRAGKPRQRPAEEMARLRAHIRKRQASRALSSSSSKAR